MTSNIEDDVLGTLRYNDLDRVWTSLSYVDSAEGIGILIYDDGSDLDAQIHRVKSMLARAISHDSEIRRFIAEALLPHYNSLKSGDPIELETFINAIQLSSVAMTAEHIGVLVYDDDNMLLGGHHIEQLIDPDGNFYQPAISGL